MSTHEKEKLIAKYLALSFIRDKSEIEFQIKNTVIFKTIIEQTKEITVLGKLLEKTQYGYTAKASVTGNCKYVRITDLKSGKVEWEQVPRCNCDCIDKYKLETNDILIARTGGTTGKSYIVNENPIISVFASYLIRLTPKKDVLPEYIYSFLNSYYFWNQITEMKSGGAQPNVNAEKMKKLKIPICPPKMQQSIWGNEKQNSYKVFTNSISKLQTKVSVSTNNVSTLSSEITRQQTLLKKLRQSILQDAISGKLTKKWRNENPNVEPASELLKRIKEEKERLIKEGKIKKQKALSPIGENEIPYRLPSGWNWVRLGEIAQHNSGKTLDRGRNKGKYRKYITTSNLYWGYFILDNLRQMPIRDVELEKCTAIKGDLLICEGGEAGRASVWDHEDYICFQNHIHRVRFFCEINPYYIYSFFEKLNFTGEINNYRKGMTISNLSGKALSSIIMPLPPIAEQTTIVTKVKKLLTFYNSIEQQIIKSQRYSEELMQTVLKEAFEG